MTRFNVYRWDVDGRPVRLWSGDAPDTHDAIHEAAEANPDIRKLEMFAREATNDPYAERAA